MRFLCVVYLLCCIGCEKNVPKEMDQHAFQLPPRQWHPAVKASLDSLIHAEAGTGKIVAFDFDNTLICRDIGEATFASLVGSRQLQVTPALESISPEFVLEGEKVSVKSSENLTEYYEKFLLSTSHHSNDVAPYANAYAWTAQIMAGLTPTDVIAATDRAFADGVGEQDVADPNRGEIKVDGYRQPFFYPEMIDLVGAFLTNGYEVYVISATSVWTVRWMVTHQLNPRLQAIYGEEAMIAPDHVFGVNMLLRDRRDGLLYKDQFLVKENPAYANSDTTEMSHYQLTNQICYPLTSYHGKVATLFQHISADRPYLIAGDSPNDHPMLNWAENRLWLARQEKPDYQEKTKSLMEDGLKGQWLVQPVRYKKGPGFVGE